MITDSILDLFFTVVTKILDLLPDEPVPGWAADVPGYVADLWGYGAQLGSWIPWSIAGMILAAVLVVYAVGFGIRLIRMLLSLGTGGGGSAG